MSTDIEGIKARAAWDPEKYRDWMGFEMRFTVGEMKAVLAELEKAEEERDTWKARAVEEARRHLRHSTEFDEQTARLTKERDAALDTLKRAQENWEKLADKAAANLARMEQERNAERERADILASDIEAAEIALDLTDASDCELSLVERIEARQRETRRLQDSVLEALEAAHHELTTLHGLTASDGLGEYSSALAEGLDAPAAWDCFIAETWTIDTVAVLKLVNTAIAAGSGANKESFVAALEKAAQS